MATKGKGGRAKKDMPPPDGHIRRSQLVNTFGSGALVDLLDRSGIVAGLQHWGDPDRQGSGFASIHEPRLLASLADEGVRRLFAPPALPREDEAAVGITVWEFPRWFMLPPLTDDDSPEGRGAVRSRKMIHRRAFRGQTYGTKKEQVVPIRFVQACRYGHVSDVDWATFVHRGPSSCAGELRMIEKTASGDFADILIWCSCKSVRSLAEAIPERPSDPNDRPLGDCQGCEPWLGPSRWNGGPGQCPTPSGEAQDDGALGKRDGPAPNRLLVRSASNAYFPELRTAISIPEKTSPIESAVAQLWAGCLEEVQSLEDLLNAMKFNPAVKKGLAGFEPAAVMPVIAHRRENGPAAPSRSLKGAEMETFLGQDLGADTPDSDFFATAVQLPAKRPKVLSFVRRVLSIKRLREVVAQVGFTRLESPTRDVDGGTLDLGVRRARLSLGTDWRPAYENRGEGVLVVFEPEHIESWLTRREVVERTGQLEAGVDAWRARRPGVPLRFPGTAYVMLHSLSHLLLTAVAVECGYAASSIRERVYAGPEGYGILLYTGTPDAEGTLGGLASTAYRIDRFLEAAIAAGTLCSNDPVCAQHAPDHALEERFFHGAACHGCLLIAEPSCEWRNDFLDRALVVPTVLQLGCEFFRGTP